MTQRVCSVCLHLVELSMKRTAELHVLHQVGALALVWSDYADLVRFGSGLQKASGDFLHISSLSPAHTTYVSFTAPMRSLKLLLYKAS